MDEIQTIEELKHENKKDLAQKIVDLYEERHQLTLENRELSVKIEALEEQYRGLQAHTENQQTELKEAGSLAEYAVQVNKILETTQKTADVYLEGVKRLKRSKEQEVQTMMESAHKKVDALIKNAQEEASQIKISSSMVLQNLRGDVEKLLGDMKDSYEKDSKGE